jgi:phosphate-selective porin OprO and OprP
MFSNKKLAVAVSGAVLLMAGQFALADSTTDIVDALVSKGVLTEEEGKLISKGAKAKADATPTVKEKDGAFVLSSPNGKNSIQLTGRLHFDAKYNNIGADNLATSGNEEALGSDLDSRSMASHYNVRRARIGLKGRIGGVADYLLQGNITGSNLLDEAYLDVNKYEPFGLKVGKFKVPFGLEQQTSSNNIDFMERSYVDQNGPAKRMGAMVHGEFTGLTYQGDLFQMNDSALSQRDHKVSTAGRVTANFAEIMGNKDMVMHVGLAGYSTNYEVSPASSNNQSDNASADTRATIFGFTSGGGGMLNAYRAQIGSVGLSSLAAGNITYGVTNPESASVKNNTYGLEGILAYNNFKLQGEYANSDYEASSTGRASKTDITPSTEYMKANVDTWYAEALWLVTGEKYSDSYKKGAFGTIKPKNEFNMDTGSGTGAIELGFRVDAFDVSDTSISGVGNISRFQGAIDASKKDSAYVACSTTGRTNCDGGAKSYTAGVKWIWNPNLLWKLNYTYTDFDHAFAPIDIGAKEAATNQLPVRGSTVNKLIDHEDLLMVRAQYSF